MIIDEALNSKTIDAIERHYLHAKEKHPYFADVLLDSIDTKDRTAVMLEIARRHIDMYAGTCLRPFDVLACEIAEAKHAIAKGDSAAAIEELYDCAAVCLRTIDVLKGRQALGKTKEGEK